MLLIKPTSNVVAVGLAAFKGSSSTPTGANGTIAIGRNALFALTTGAGNVAIGYYTLDNITTGASNTAVGRQAGFNNATGGYNSYFGFNAGYGGSGNESFNTGIGRGSLQAITSGPQNTAVGNNSGEAITDGGQNTTIGDNAGDTITGGDYNTIIGASADTSAADSANQTVVGYGATAQADNSVTLGNASVTAVYMSQDSQASVYAGQVKLSLDQQGSSGGDFSGTGATVGLHISSSGVPYVKFTETNAASSGTADFEIYAANQTFVLYDVDDGAQVFNVNTSQVISGDFNDTSDIGLKENIVSISEGLSIINQLNPVTFDWKKKSKGTNSGFIAQEVEKILPDDVEGTDYDESLKDLPPATVDNAGKSINLGGIVAHLTKAVQELSEKVEAQQKEIEELKKT